jgi:hypothetical protein
MGKLQTHLPVKRYFFALLFCVMIHQLPAQQLAFPGADGFGRYTRGGRGGKVIEVTNLNDTGPGSLRAAITATGARTVVFRVSGTILLASRLEIKNDSITIAGQTAPGDGICLRKYPLFISANEVVVRYIRSRLGNESGGEDDAMTSFSNRRHIIVDHCTASWSVDETLSYYNNDSMTVQWCIVSESLYDSNHPKGAHGYGGIWGGRNSTFHHNLLAHHSSRNPRFSGLGTSVVAVNLDFRNNVIYNWGFNSAYGGEAGTFNIVANYFKYGPATKGSVRGRIVEPYDAVARWYITDNFVDGNAATTTNNWNGGVQGAYASNTAIKATAPFLFSQVTTHTADEAYSLVLNDAGASRPKRDTVDARIVYEVRNRTATYTGVTYSKTQNLDTTVIRGIIDTQNDVGGWPVLNSTTPPDDSDHDGMPDSWELAHGLNPSDPEDRNNIGSGGFTMLEVYLSELTSVPTSVPDVPSTPSRFVLHQNFPNPFNPSTAIRYELQSRSNVTLTVFDILGREVALLENGVREAGIHEVTYRAGRNLASGIYYCRLNAAGMQETIRLLLVK